MNLIKLTPLLAVFLTCATSQIRAQVDTAVEDPVVKKRLLRIKATFEQLPKERITAFQAFKKKAIESNKQQKYFTSLIALNDALVIFEDDIDLLWLKGVCHAQLHDVDSAVFNYKKALEIHPHHAPSLLNIVEIYFYHNRYEEALEYMTYIRKFLGSVGADSSPLFDFKYLITLTRLAKEQPEKYTEDLKKMQNLYEYLDDSPYYYYSKALQMLDAGKSNEGQVWIYKAAAIFNNAQAIKTWNKALIDADFLTAYDIVIDVKPTKR